MAITLVLPYPPSANRYYRNVGFRPCGRLCGRTLISREGRAYRRRVYALLAPRLGSGQGDGPRKPPADGRIALAMDAFPPDRRRRDLDNLQKAVLDSLARAGVYADDSQVDLLVVRRREPLAGGRVCVRVEQLPLARCPLCGGPFPEHN